jgi:hypothetical protein
MALTRGFKKDRAITKSSNLLLFGKSTLAHRSVLVPKE